MNLGLSWVTISKVLAFIIFIWNTELSVDLPEFLKSGERARLIPVASSTHKERYAASVFLATLSIVAPYCREVLATLGKRVGQRSNIQSFTEVVFKQAAGKANIRPDGLLILDTSRTQWKALIEAKIGTAKIDPRQVEQYVELARENNIDAVITISNELASMPEQTPYALATRTGGKVAIYHWSWMRLITVATLLIGGEEPFDPEQHYILKEMLRYFTHENIGVRGVHRMNADWKRLMTKIHAGGQIKKNDEEVTNTVCCWHQEVQDICLLLSRKLKVPVGLGLRRHHREDQSARISDDATQLAETKRLTSVFEIPDVAGPIEVVAHAMRRNIICRMQLAAPLDLQKYTSRLRWLLRQLPEDIESSASLRIYWGGGGETFAPILGLKENPEIAEIGRPGALPKSFEIATVMDMGVKFTGPASFVEGLESAVPLFYDNIVRHIEAWQPAPPVGPARGDVESLSEEIDALPGTKKRPKKVVQKGEIDGRAFTIFEDGSIEVETTQGVKWFKDLAALQSF